MFTTEIPCKHTERRIAPLEMQFEKCTAKIMSKRPSTVVSWRQTLPSLTELAFGSHPPIRLSTLYYLLQQKYSDKATFYFLLHSASSTSILRSLSSSSSSKGAPPRELKSSREEGTWTEDPGGGGDCDSAEAIVGGGRCRSCGDCSSSLCFLRRYLLLGIAAPSGPLAGGRPFLEGDMKPIDKPSRALKKTNPVSTPNTKKH